MNHAQTYLYQFDIHVSYMYLFFFFFNDTATPEIYPLSLHDALPISFTYRWSISRSIRTWQGPGIGVSRTPPRKAENRNGDRKSTRLNSSHLVISYAVFCLKKKKIKKCCIYDNKDNM